MTAHSLSEYTSTKLSCSLSGETGLVVAEEEEESSSWGVVMGVVMEVVTRGDVSTFTGDSVCVSVWGGGGGGGGYHVVQNEK